MFVFSNELFERNTVEVVGHLASINPFFLLNSGIVFKEKVMMKLIEAVLVWLHIQDAFMFRYKL